MTSRPDGSTHALRQHQGKHGGDNSLVYPLYSSGHLLFFPRSSPLETLLTTSCYERRGVVVSQRPQGLCGLHTLNLCRDLGQDRFSIDYDTIA
jgi:hypothetical protein